MDFGALLNVAQRNSASGKKSEKSNYYSTKFEAPKKESKERKLSANIQKFLQKQEHDEVAKQRLAKQKLDDLMASRDTKSKNKIKKMLKVTKSANKSVLDDAVDMDNTAYTLQGPEQPDEDDYGYVSTEAGALYKQLMDKYKACPEEKKFSASRPQSKYDLDGTKDRVRAAIMREREEENGPHRRKRTSHAESRPSSSSTSATAVHVRKRANIYDPEEEKRQAEQKKRDEQRAKAKYRAPPPVMDFATILKLAEKKQFEPVEVEVEVKKKEPERLLTTKEKRELEERQRFMAEREKRKQERDKPKSEVLIGKIPKVGEEPRKAMEPNGRIPKIGGESRKPMEPNGRIPKLNSSAQSNSYTSIAKSTVEPRKNGSSSSRVSASTSSMSNTNSSSKDRSSAVPSVSGSSKLQTALTSKPRDFPPKDVIRKVVQPDQKMRTPHPSASKESSRSESTAKPNPPASLTKSKITVQSTSSNNKTTPSNNKTNSHFASLNGKPRPLTNGKSIPADVKTRPFPPNDIKPRQMPSDNVKTRQFPPSDVKSRPFPPQGGNKRPEQGSGSRPFPPSDVRRPNGINSITKRPMKRHVIDDDDSEYDSEMDDFIDDGPEEENYSKYIKEIFGYDKSRYKNLDENVDNMESSFAQQMKEEFISKKIGLMEDLEDMRLEAEEKKRSKSKRRRLSDDDDF